MKNEVLDKMWNKNYNKLYKYYKEFGNLDIDDKSIQIWLKKQRFLYKNNKLSDIKINFLNNMSIDWFPEKKKYSQMLDTLENANYTVEELLNDIEYQQLKNLSNNINYSDIKERLISIERKVGVA